MVCRQYLSDISILPDYCAVKRGAESKHYFLVFFWVLGRCFAGME
jgi:hypothetical protein